MSVVVILLAMTSFTYIVAERESETLSKELLKQAEVLADNLAASTASYIIVKDYTSLESILIRSARFPSILDIQAINDNGLLLADVYRNNNGEPAVRYNTKAPVPPADMERQIKIKDGQITVWQPVILGDLVGWVRTRYTLHRIDEVRSQIWLQNMLIGAIVAVISILIFSLYLRKPFHLIDEATGFADALDMDAGRQINVDRSYEEISRLESALNRTSLNLRAKNEALNQKIREQEKLTDELEQRVSERTMELSIARDDAIKANRSKSEFLANMSHEIRTPLTAVIGFAESLLDSSHNMEERVDAIYRIIQAGKHLLRIINEILDLSKIEANRLEMEFIPFQLADVLRDIYSLSKLQAAEKSLGFRISYEGPVPETIKSDPVRLKQILLNLCNNAIKFTMQGSIQVKISCKPESECLIIKVIDSGIGLSQEQLGRMFRPFTQADASTTRKYGGTGLGLHLSRQLAEKLGGSLGVESVQDVGSCFTLTIGTGKLDNARLLTDTPNFEHVDSVITSQRGRKKYQGKVLLTEDNQNNQRLVALLLKRMGIEYKIASNGSEAIEMLKGEAFDLVLMDVQMPVMDGLTATRILRKQGYSGPIISLTANAMIQEKQDCYDAGCNGICTKPIDYADFEKMLGEYLSVPAESRPEIGEPIISGLLVNEPELFELVSEFVNKLPEMIKNIQTAYDAQQLDKLRAEVHTLKGTGGNFGYSELFNLAKRIEFEIVAGNQPAAGELIDALAEVARRIESGIELTRSGGDIRKFTLRS